MGMTKSEKEGWCLGIAALVCVAMFLMGALVRPVVDGAFGWNQPGCDYSALTKPPVVMDYDGFGGVKVCSSIGICDGRVFVEKGSCPSVNWESCDTHLRDSFYLGKCFMEPGFEERCYQTFCYGCDDLRRIIDDQNHILAEYRACSVTCAPGVAPPDGR